MLDEYEEYYLPDDTIKSMAKNADIVFDTSALLQLLVYTERGQIEINTIFDSYLSGRLWLPGHVLFEFYKNKNTYLKIAQDKYEALVSGHDGNYIKKIKDSFTHAQSTYKNQITALKDALKNPQKHPSLQLDNLTSVEDTYKVICSDLEIFLSKLIKLENELSTKSEEQKQLLSSRFHTRARQILSFFEFGNEYPLSKMLTIANEGKLRYEESIPPGYKDNQKIGIQKYGDLIIWKQTIDHSIENHSNIIFVTQDNKEDWIDKDINKPRYELLNEFYSETGYHCWIMNLRDFLPLVSNLLKEDKRAQEAKILDDFIQDLDIDWYLDEEEFEATAKKYIEEETVLSEMVPRHIEAETEDYSVHEIKKRDYPFLNAPIHILEGQAIFDTKKNCYFVFFLPEQSGKTYIESLFNCCFNLCKELNADQRYNQFRLIVIFPSYSTGQGILDSFRADGTLFMHFCDYNTMLIDICYVSNEDYLITPYSNHAMG